MVSLTPLRSRPLCRTFGIEAENIWKALGKASASGLIRGEETITDDLLLNVQTAHPYEVITYQFNRHEESFTGADWEWWLTDGHLWFGLLIQAKRLDLKSHKYPQIKKLVGKTKTPQIDLLMQQAQRKGIDPLYFFYNYSSGKPSTFTWNCGSTPFDLLQLGCSVAHAAAVKRALAKGGAGLPKISPISYPLRCLVCCPVLAEPDDSLPGCAHGIAKRLRLFAEHVDATPDRDPHPLPQPPDYVLRLLGTAPEDRGGVIDELREQVGPIGSLVIIKDRREDSGVRSK